MLIYDQIRNVKLFKFYSLKITIGHICETTVQLISIKMDRKHSLESAKVLHLFVEVQTNKGLKRNKSAVPLNCKEAVKASCTIVFVQKFVWINMKNKIIIFVVLVSLGTNPCNLHFIQLYMVMFAIKILILSVQLDSNFLTFSMLVTFYFNSQNVCWYTDS